MQKLEVNNIDFSISKVVVKNCIPESLGITLLINKTEDFPETPKIHKANKENTINNLYNLDLTYNKERAIKGIKKISKETKLLTENVTLKKV